MAEAAEHCRNTTPHCKARRTCRRLGTGVGAAAAQRPLMSKPKLVVPNRQPQLDRDE